MGACSFDTVLLLTDIILLSHMYSVGHLTCHPVFVCQHTTGSKQCVPVGQDT